MGASWAEANTGRPNDRIKATEWKTLSRAVIGFSLMEIAPGRRLPEVEGSNSKHVV
jgi:hypothetical protein